MIDRAHTERTIRALFLLSGGVLLAELFLMLCVGRAPGALDGARAVLDSVLLTAGPFPLLYVFWGLPSDKYRSRLEQEIRDRKLAEVRLAEDQTKLPPLIAERTGELEAERKKLETLLERLPEGVVLVDEERRVLLANRVAREYMPFLIGRVVDHELSRIEGVNAP